ncbi:hypothetical protein J6590_048350 [Homalodisca vitripennis]|nr:hypothetical protein J6590_048350 [Homalodisca vitripennis]
MKLHKRARQRLICMTSPSICRCPVFGRQLAAEFTAVTPPLCPASEGCNPPHGRPPRRVSRAALKYSPAAAHTAAPPSLVLALSELCDKWPSSLVLSAQVIFELADRPKRLAPNRPLKSADIITITINDVETVDDHCKLAVYIFTTVKPHIVVGPQSLVPLTTEQFTLRNSGKVRQISTVLPVLCNLTIASLAFTDHCYPISASNCYSLCFIQAAGRHLVCKAGRRVAASLSRSLALLDPCNPVSFRRYWWITLFK